MKHVVLAQINGSGDSVAGPFDSREAAFEWAKEDRMSRGYCDQSQTIGTDYLSWESGTNMKLEWTVLPLNQNTNQMGPKETPLNLSFPFGVLLRARIEGCDYIIEEFNGFQHARIFGVESVASMALVRHITGLEPPRAGEFMNVKSDMLRRILTGKTIPTLDLLQMAVDYTLECMQQDSVKNDIEADVMDERHLRASALDEKMDNLANYVATYKVHPAPMFEDVVQMMRNYWAV